MNPASNQSATRKSATSQPPTGLPNVEHIPPAEPPLHAASYHAWKEPIERGLALLLLVPGLPIIALLMLLVRLTSPGPGIYRQVRVGRHGKTFAMYKIRTMYSDAERLSGPAWTQKNDPRITRLGRVLRTLHLDEFPQLFNVIKGEMALIGPRPERPEFTQVLAREIPRYMDRVLVLPGITGLAQINLPPDTDLDSVRRKLVLDLEYVQTANMRLDIRMLVCTLLRLLGLRGDFAMRLMRLQREVKLPPVAAVRAGTEPVSVEHTTPAALVSNSCLAKAPLLCSLVSISPTTDDGLADHGLADDSLIAGTVGQPSAGASKNRAVPGSIRHFGTQ